MRKLFFALLAISLMMAFSASEVLAQEEVIHYRTSINRMMYSCNGESVRIVGDRHWIFHRHTDSNGGEHFVHQINDKGSGLGQTSGLKYQFNEHGRGQIMNTNGRQWELTWEYTWTLVAPGPNNNIVAHATDHVTRNANGEITVDHYTSHTECR